MPLKDHPAYKEEVKRLAYTTRDIEEFIASIEENKQAYKDNIREAFINLDYLDSSQSYISILTNAKFLELDSRHLDELRRAKEKPYFGRVDFKEKHSSNVEKLYIGKVSLPDKEFKKPLIIDWRAPIANVYYEGRLGEVSYDTPRGSVSGELHLKRQYTINDGRLENILDIDITTNDTFLQTSLEATADNRLKDIAASIQAEQNKIIRADIEEPLIVQGAAGSGKTTIALHRIAFLIYTYEENFNPENFMVLAPSRLFLNYISEVLPELGVEKVRQTTFADLLVELLGIKYKLEDPNEKLKTFISKRSGPEHAEKDALLKWESSFKGSMLFKEIIDGYIEELERGFVPAEDFSLDEYVIVGNDDIKRMFLEEYRHLPLYKRLNEIKKHLSYKLKSSKEKIIGEVDNSYSARLNKLRSAAPEDEEARAEIIELINAKNEKIDRLKSAARTMVTKYMAGFPRRDLLDYYKALITSEELLDRYSDGKVTGVEARFLCSFSLDLLNKKRFEIEDGAALLYLKLRIFGLDEKLEVENVVIDEAQDLSVFQLYTLREVLGTRRFTVFGDLAQGIHSYRGVRDWHSLAREVFPEGFNYLTLEQSYRTTIEIMNTANQILQKHAPPGVAPAKPVIRHGEKPVIKYFDSGDEIVGLVKEQVKELQSAGYKSIALICKTLDECKKLKAQLGRHGEPGFRLLSGEEVDYGGGVMLVPSYVSKGLEFDVVFIINIDESYNDKEMDVKLLYVAMTRALHKLYVYYKKNSIPLLEGIQI